MHGQVASLNVSVAAAVVLFEAERQRAAAGLYARPRLSRAARERLLFEWAYPRLAGWCRARGRPYPALDERGFLASDPRA
jgi:tRNA (guanosine-2'-O-)-methyltransferase